MTEINAALVRELREATNVSMMECKRALVEAGGDMQQAMRLLRERGMAVAAKKAARAANQGLVASASADAGKTVSLVEVNCETDFVARNEVFKGFVERVAQKACEGDAPLADVLKNEVTAKVAEIGENVVLRRNVRYVLQGAGLVAAYIHLGGKVGVLVEAACGKPETASADAFREVVKDITLHVAASAPRYLTSSEIPAEEIASERAIYAKQVTNKPPQIVEKIVDGKMKKFYGEVCLVDQPFVKEPKISVTGLLAQKGKELGDTLAIRRFVRYQVGA
jgi:elongation factor Ts